MAMSDRPKPRGGIVRGPADLAQQSVGNREETFFALVTKDMVFWNCILMVRTAAYERPLQDYWTGDWGIWQVYSFHLTRKRAERHAIKVLGKIRDGKLPKVRKQERYEVYLESNEC